MSLIFLLMVTAGLSISGAQAADSDGLEVSSYMADLEYGEFLFQDICMNCHGEDGQGGPAGGAPLTDSLVLTDITTIVIEGRNTMPSFKGFFDDEELVDVATYVIDVLVAK